MMILKIELIIYIKKKLEDKNRQQLRTKSVAPRMLLNPHSPSEKDAFKMKKF